MCTLSNTAGSDSYSEEPGEIGNTTKIITRKNYYKDLINKANTVSLIKIFKHYNLRLDEYNKKIICPLKSHQGGRESTPSFYLYAETNTYYCFGCKSGVRASDFISAMDRCTKVQAAYKILEIFDSDVDDDKVYDSDNFTERLEIMLDFSNSIREFYQRYISEDAITYIEVACKKYDDLNLKHDKLDNNALKSIVQQLKNYIELYIT
jgi:DNA primase